MQPALSSMRAMRRKISVKRTEKDQLRVITFYEKCKVFGKKDLFMGNYFVTGAAGFIASRVAEFLIKDGHTVVGVDNLNDAYDLSA
jgi:hypothetical protein